jgi:hypothetical protein
MKLKNLVTPQKNNLKCVLLKDGSIVFSKFFGYKKLYKFDNSNTTLISKK